MVTVYVLKLKFGKYYVGKTNNTKFRFSDHFNFNGSEWTKKYKPIKVIQVIHNCDNFDEDKITLKFMDEYGIDNVRGGTFVNIKLSEKVIDVISQMINGANNKCFLCGNLLVVMLI